MTTTRTPLCLAAIAWIFAMSCPLPAIAAGDDAALAARVDRVLKATPLIDGHNDLPWEIRERFGGVAGVNLAASLAKLPRKPGSDDDQSAIQTDLPRLHAGHVGGQFWSVWIPPTVTGPAAVMMTIEQIDLVHALAAR